jgi:ABC-type Zn uptake system ZnuABC Zn-binding protein ZnuA
MVRRVLAALSVLAVGAAVLAGCSSRSGAAGDGVPVVATTTQAGDMVRAVGGDRVHVDQLLAPNADPHEYEPRPSDAQALSGAKVVVRSGGDVDDWLASLIEATGKPDQSVTLIDSVDRHGDDPHWWQDPRGGERAVAAIRDALVKADPSGADGYRQRAASYIARLKRLDAAIARCVGRLPVAGRKLVTSHDALGYFARRYGFTVIGAAIPSRSTQAQPSAAATARLVDQIRRERVPAIFPESSLNPKLERAIARDAGAKVGGALWADSLGPKGSSGATYLGSLAANAETVVAGLGGGKCGL